MKDFFENFLNAVPGEIEALGLSTLLTLIVTFVIVAINEYLLSQRKKETKTRVEKIIKSDKNKTILEHLGYNVESISNIYNWSQTQAKISFIFAMIMCTVGLGLIIASVGLIFTTEISVEEKTSAAIISAIGGTTAELISLTTLLVYRTSLNQLSHYHDYLHEDERFLTSINLIDSFENSENHDEMLKEIIRSEIQLNILETKKKTDIKHTVKIKNKSK